MLEFTEKNRMITVEPMHVVGIGTKEEIMEFLRHSAIGTYYNFDKCGHVTFEMREDDFLYRDKKECRVTINETLYSKPYIDQIIEYTCGKKMIVKDETRPYKHAIGKKYEFKYLLCDAKDFPLVLTRADEKDDMWFILAPIVDDD